MSDEKPILGSRERDIFLEALETPSGKEREAFLLNACGDDHPLRKSIDELLRADDSVEAAFLAPPPEIELLKKQERAPVEDLSPGEVLGPYEITGTLGEGAFARVYEAHQRHPVSRDVALKILKPGMDSEQIITRFESERQALAIMGHPNIAHVYDAGTTTRGRPFFVMELVPGEPVTEFCDNHCLPISERLRIFITVCGAVQHAHQKAIIHRDLKPSNILVAMQEGLPVPKIIDFGIAKAIRSSGAPNTLTLEGQFMGTPQYMSPEQAGYNDWDVDTRSDIYSLGVVLFELITGGTPLEKEDLQNQSFTAMEHMIRNEEAPLPSVHLISLGARAASVATARNIDLQKLTSNIQGDLDWIVLKALEKDRSRRYESAAEFGRDLERFLNHEPVAARPPSYSYLAGRFIRRNRAIVATAAIILLALIAGILSSTWHAREMEQARQASEAARIESDAVASFLENTFRSPGPDRAGRALTVAEMLSLASERLHEETTLNPTNRARLFAAVGRCYGSLGLRSDAVTNLKAAVAIYSGALGDSDPVTLETMKHLAGAYRHSGDFDEASTIAEAVAQRCRESMGPEDPARILAIQNLADTYRAGGRLEEATQTMEEAAESWTDLHGPNHLRTLTCLGRLTQVYQNSGKNQEAVSLQEDVVERSRLHLGDDSPATTIQVDRLARVYLMSGRADQAYPLAVELANLNRVLHGDKHLATLSALFLVARAEKSTRRLDDALAHHREVLQHRLEILGPDHFDTLESTNQLAATLHAANRDEEALPFALECLERRRAILGVDHYQTTTAELTLAQIHLSLGMNEEAIPLYRDLVEARRLNLGPDSPLTLNSMSNLAIALRKVGNFQEAIRIQEETLARRRKVLGPEDLATLHTLTNLGNNLADIGRTGEAVECFEQALAIRETRYPDTTVSIRYLNTRLAQVAGAPESGREARPPGEFSSP